MKRALAIFSLNMIHSQTKSIVIFMVRIINLINNNTIEKKLNDYIIQN